MKREIYNCPHCNEEIMLDDTRALVSRIASLEKENAELRRVLKVSKVALKQFSSKSYLAEATVLEIDAAIDSAAKEGK